MQKRDLKVGDIVQINPEKDKYGGFFLVVTEVKCFGVQGYLLSHCNFPAVRIASSGKAFLRVAWEDMEYIGESYWIHEDREIESDE
jgi:hypothetical protein